MSDTLAAEIASLTDKVAAEADAARSAETLLKDLHDKFDAVAADLQNAGVDPAQLQALHELNAQIAAHTAELAAAVAANTPASTTPSTPPSGDPAPTP